MRTAIASSHWIGLLFATILGLAACSSADGGNGTTAGSPVIAESPLVHCSGTYFCAGFDGAVGRGFLEKTDDGVCALHFGPGYTPLEEDKRYQDWTWEGSTKALRLCRDSDGKCIECKATEDASPTADPDARCSGTPSSCSGRGESTCSSVRGCSLEVHVQYDGSSTLKCGGVARSCSQMGSQEVCERQGCTWK